MPVHKNTTKNFEVVIKSLRGREISCRIATVSPLQKDFHEDSKKNAPKEDVEEEKSPIKAHRPANDSFKNTQGKIHSQKEKGKLQESSSEIVVKDEVLQEFSTENATKESICKNENKIEEHQPPIEPLKESEENSSRLKEVKQKLESPSESGSSAVQITPIADKKHPLNSRKTLNISRIAKRFSTSEPDLTDGNARLTTPSATIKYYTGGIVSGVEPRSPPVIINCETMGVVNTTPTVPRRGRGRPPGRKTKPSPVTVEEESSSSIMSQDSRMSTESRRSKKLKYRDIYESHEEEEPPSEYEMLRLRNIEDNKKMLKQIFMDQGLDFDERSSSHALKVKKPYTRLPLPPPRPKSVRLSERYSADPLDFSDLEKRLSMLN